MSPTQTELETRLVSTLRAKGAQVPEPDGAFDADVVHLALDEPRRPRSRVLAIVAVAALVVAVAIGVAVALGGGGDTQPAGEPAPEPVARVSIVALPELKFQSPEFTTVAGLNEIEFRSEGGTHALVFADPTLKGFQLSASDPGDVGRGVVDLKPGDYTVYCAIPGHRQAGMEAVIHVIDPTKAPTSSDVVSTTLPPPPPTTP